MTTREAGLLDKARRSINGAKLLMEHRYYDFAASRAYFALFYVAQALLLSKGLSFSSHGDVIAAIEEHFVKTGLIEPRFHGSLVEGRDLRTKADYEVDPGITALRANEVIAHAQQFVHAAERLLAA